MLESRSYFSSKPGSANAAVARSKRLKKPDEPQGESRIEKIAHADSLLFLLMKSSAKRF